ncbi:MAG TPA: hypothetical protein TECP_00469 [Hyphomicrobiaceae bacterium MAG_BT-2024]
MYIYLITINIAVKFVLLIELYYPFRKIFRCISYVLLLNNLGLLKYRYRPSLGWRVCFSVSLGNNLSKPLLYKVSSTLHGSPSLKK